MATLALPATSVKVFSATVMATLECFTPRLVAYRADLLTGLIVNGNLVLEASSPTLTIIGSGGIDAAANTITFNFARIHLLFRIMLLIQLSVNISSFLGHVQILQQLIPSQTPDRFSKLLCSTVYNKLEHYNKQVNVCSTLCPNNLGHAVIVFMID
jgi:hypothetical protein